METHSVRKNPLVALAVVVAVVVAVFALSYVGLLAMAGNDDYEGSAVDTYQPADEGAASVESATGDLEPVFVSAEELSTPETPTNTPTLDLEVPVDEHDCEAFFAELDEQYYADQERLLEVLERFDVPFERIVGDDVSVELDFDDPIVESITTSFWNEVAEDVDDDVRNHPCLNDVGCADGEDYEMSEEDKAEFRDDWAIEDAALVAAFTEAGIEFGWETDEYFETDRVTWDYQDEAATEVYLQVFNELHPEFSDLEDNSDSYDAADYSEEDHAADMAALDQQLEERAAELEAFAVALDDAGVDHEITNEYDWTIVTFDLDDDRAIAVVAAAR